MGAGCDTATHSGSNGIFGELPLSMIAGDFGMACAVAGGFKVA